VCAVVVRSQTAVEVQIDVAAGRHSIDARIYGVAFADVASLADLRVPIHRWGGNATSRYNWQANGSNRASDWYFESIGDSSATAGDSADTFVSQSKANGAEPIITIPMVGWVVKLGPGRSKLASFRRPVSL
jgi:alpha-L-arabinofuranosidase